MSLNYGHAAALGLDPIEKKPFARFRPGSRILSYGSFGCNMACPFCQNSDISQVRTCAPPQTAFVSPADLVAKAQELQAAGNIGIALTYNEPLVSPEFLMDVGCRLKEANMALVLVTNGYATAEVFDNACTLVAAMNIDLKCFTSDGYRKMGAPKGLETVKRNIEAALRADVHVEVTTLLVPGLSDSEDEFRAEVDWLAGLSPDIPLHLTRFFPAYGMAKEAPTDLGCMERLSALARERLNHVFLGNVP